MVVTSFVSAEASATEETEDSRLRDMEACDWSIVRMEDADWLIDTEVLRLMLGRVEFRPETGGELPSVKLGREGEPRQHKQDVNFKKLELPELTWQRCRGDVSLAVRSEHGGAVLPLARPQARHHPGVQAVQH